MILQRKCCKRQCAAQLLIIEDADLSDIQPPCIQGSRVEQLPGFRALHRDGDVRFHGAPAHGSRIPADAGGNIRRDHKRTGVTHLLDQDTGTSGHFPGEPGPENCVHDNRIDSHIRVLHFTDAECPAGLHLSLHIRREALFISRDEKIRFDSLYKKDPCKRRAVAPVVAGPAHDEDPARMGFQGCGHFLRDGEGRPLHEHGRGNLQVLYGMGVHRPHFLTRNHMQHMATSLTLLL